MGSFVSLLAGVMVFASVWPGCGGCGGGQEGFRLDSAVVAARFNPDGTPDTYGNGNSVWVNSTQDEGTARDGLWSASVDWMDRLVIFGRQPAVQSDTHDRNVIRLTHNGAFDTTFGGRGVVSFDLGSDVNDEQRHGLVQPDGRILSAGYASVPTGVGTQSANRIVLFRLNDNGAFDSTFGSGGFVSSNPFPSANPLTEPWGMAEAYGVGLQGGQYVVAGYGRRASSGPVDIVGFRYSSAGTQDMAWGVAGALVHDVATDNDRARNLVVLPDGRVLIAGSGTISSGNVDALLLMLDANGQPDPTFGPGGRRTFGFGRADEAFFGLALSPDGQWVAAVGHVAGGDAADQPLLAVIPLGAGGEFINVTPLPGIEAARYTSVVFNATSDRVHAAGYASTSTDRSMLLTSFRRDGSLDESFGQGGLVELNANPTSETNIIDNTELARAVARQSDGKLILVGEADLLVPTERQNY